MTNSFKVCTLKLGNDKQFQGVYLETWNFIYAHKKSTAFPAQILGNSDVQQYYSSDL